MWLSDLRDIDALAQELFQAGRAGTVMNTQKDDQGVTYEFDMPGVSVEDIDITTNNGVLTVTARGERRSYRQSMTLPTTIDVDKATAEYESGVLCLSFPWSEVAKPKRIEIASSSRRQLTSDTS